MKIYVCKEAPDWLTDSFVIDKDPGHMFHVDGKQLKVVLSSHIFELVPGGTVSYGSEEL